MAAFGIFYGVMGIKAGFIEILTGNTVVNDFIISTIGSNYTLADNFNYFALQSFQIFY
ncbi:MAG: hypothetical protein ACFFFH_00635 [Candidatus Thorarchaeota archaeon]